MKAALFASTLFITSSIVTLVALKTISSVVLSDIAAGSAVDAKAEVSDTIGYVEFDPDSELGFATFTVRNSGAGRLIVHVYQAECQCRLSIIEPQIILAGQSGQIKIPMHRMELDRASKLDYELHTSDPTHPVISVTATWKQSS
jgi:hypothetical protein